MTVSEALAILESAVLECTKRDINTPEITEALNFLEPHARPPWLIAQLRYHLDLDPCVELEFQQQVLRVTFLGIRQSVRKLIGKQMDALAKKFHETHDLKVKDEIDRLAREHAKLKEPVFGAG